MQVPGRGEADGVDGVPRRGRRQPLLLLPAPWEGVVVETGGVEGARGAVDVGEQGDDEALDVQRADPRPQDRDVQ